MTDIHGQTEKGASSHHGQHLCQVWLKYTEHFYPYCLQNAIFPLLSIITLTSKINRVHPLIMGNIYAKFYQNTLNTLIFIVFTRLFQLLSIVTFTFDLWHPKSIGFILTSWAITLLSLVNIHTQWFYIYCVNKVIFLFRVLWPWPVPLPCIVTLICDLQINRLHPINMIEIFTKFDEDWHNGIVSIAFTISKRDERKPQEHFYNPPHRATSCAGIINRKQYQPLTTWSSCILRTSGRRMRRKNSPRFL